MKPYEQVQATVVFFTQQDVLVASEENDNLGGAIWG